MNAAELQVAVGSLRGIAEEMGTALIHSALSPNIKERRDCSTALFDADGRLVIQAEHIPVHLGALPASVAAVRAHDVAPGEVWVLNDPFLGGSHLPDITLVSPIHVDGELLGWAASRAHHADVGGMVPASMPADSTELHQEGLILPPTRLDDDADRPDRRELARRRRAPRRPARPARRAPARRAPRRRARRAPRRGLVAHRLRRGVGLRRAPHARRDRRDAGRALRGDRDRRGGRGRPRDPRGGRDRRRRGARRLRRHGAAARRQPQLPARGHRVGVLLRAARVADPDAPASGGAYAPIEVAAPEGSLVNARPPAAVVAGNVETSSRIADCLLRAFGKAVDAPAQGQGTMNNLTFGSPRFTYYETIGGGQGGSAAGTGPVGRARGDVEHAQHAGRGARGRLSAARRALRAAGRAAAAPAATPAATA